MSYNGYADQDAFHDALADAWADILSTPEGRAEHERNYGPGTTSHAGCDHANDYCVVRSTQEHDEWCWIACPHLTAPIERSTT